MLPCPNTWFWIYESCQCSNQFFCNNECRHNSFNFTILNFSDAEYQFKNLNATNARLLYIRDKRPIHVHESS